MMERRARSYSARLRVIFHSGNLRQEHLASPLVATPESLTDEVEDDKENWEEIVG